LFAGVVLMQTMFNFCSYRNIKEEKNKEGAILILKFFIFFNGENNYVGNGSFIPIKFLIGGLSCPIQTFLMGDFFTYFSLLLVANFRHS
jgi:hypothetical protein